VCVGAWAFACACVRASLLIQHATSMRHVLTSLVAPLAQQHYSTLSHKRHDFRKTLLNMKCVFEKSSTIQFHQNPFSGSRAVPCGRMDEYDEANNRFS
jgi:hypothetical protein